MRFVTPSRFVLILLGIALVVGFRLHASKVAAAAPARGAGVSLPVPVSVATASRVDLPVRLSALGSVTAFNTVTVRPRVDGQLVRVAFREGQFVRQGDVLAQIDPSS